MAEERSPKKLKTIEFRDSSSTTLPSSARSNSVATKVLLDDAHNGFASGNFVCSPFSIDTVMGMLAAGAEGKTLKQLLEFLGYESTVDQLLFKSPTAILLSQISSDTTCAGLDICIANGVWVDKSFNRVQSCYEEVLKKVYKTEARFLDFKNKSNQSAREINSWVNHNTRGLIPAIVNGSDLIGVVIALANALYFKGLWSEPFDKNFTKEKDFHLMNGETVRVPLMTSIKKFNYGSFEGYKILQIPYVREGQLNNFSMYIFLPDRKDGWQELLQVFHSNPALFQKRFPLDHWTRLDELWIPKFKISCIFDPKVAMKQMGLTLPFEPMNMELNRILESTNPGGDMPYVSRILQKSFIEVDEKGTEAAACTILLARKTCARRKKPPPPKPKPRFVADHPFMFMIREDTSMAVFFIGVVLNPRSMLNN